MDSAFTGGVSATPNVPGRQIMSRPPGDESAPFQEHADEIIPPASGDQGGMTPEQWSWLTGFMTNSHKTMVDNNNAIVKRLDLMSKDISQLQASDFHLIFLHTKKIYFKFHFNAN